MFIGNAYPSARGFWRPPSWPPAPRRPRPGADFFKGKTVTYIVSTAPGGGYDLYGRLIAEYMQRISAGLHLCGEERARRRPHDRHQHHLRVEGRTA